MFLIFLATVCGRVSYLYLGADFRIREQLFNDYLRIIAVLWWQSYLRSLIVIFTETLDQTPFCVCYFGTGE